jgi:hypothetical protein
VSREKSRVRNPARAGQVTSAIQPPTWDLFRDCAGPRISLGRVSANFPTTRGVPLQLDDRMKQLLRELGHAINDTVSDSDRISEAISGVRSAGFDIVLKLDATIGLARRAAGDAKMTNQDRRFLESLHIRVDDESMQEETIEPRVDITPQDVKFLKSLKVSFDDDI